jgi:hypothetical protein
MNDGSGDWSTDGCIKLTDTTDMDRTVCQCDHLTSFAVLIVSIVIVLNNVVVGEVGMLELQKLNLTHPLKMTDLLWIPLSSSHK